MRPPEPDAGLRRARGAVIPSLTSVRFFAAVAVVLHHYGDAAIGAAPGVLQNIVRQGFLGVGFFFVLSGFVLVHAHQEPRLVAGGFWRRRAVRILPALWLAFLLAAPRVIVHHLDASGPVVGGAKIAVSGAVNLSLLDAWMPWASSAWNYPSWTISAEAFFYLLFPWLLPRIRSLTPGRAGLMFVGVWVTGLLVPVAALLTYPEGMRGPGYFYPHLPLLHLPAFVCGMCARRWMSGQAVRASISRWHSLLLPLAFVAVFLAVGLDWSAWAPLPQLNLHVPIWAALFVVILGAPTDRSPVLGGRWLVLLGEASYGVYILQAPVWLMLEGVGGPASTPSRLLGYLAVLILVAVMVWRYIEVPARRRFGLERKAAVVRSSP